MIFFESFFLNFELNFFDFILNLSLFNDLRFSLMKSITRSATFILKSRRTNLFRWERFIIDQLKVVKNHKNDINE